MSGSEIKIPQKIDHSYRCALWLNGKIIDHSGCDCICHSEQVCQFCDVPLNNCFCGAISLPPAPATPMVSHTENCKHDCRYPHGFWCECRCHELEIRNEVVVRPTSTFNTILDEMKTVHGKKSADYANPSDRFSNFTEAASEAGCSVDTVFRVLIGIKNGRIKQLMNSGVAPKNESLEDSILDRTVYSVLWMAWRREHEVIE